MRGGAAKGFDYNDSDKDGMIGFTEFLNMLSALEANVGMAEARVGFRQIDDDGSIDRHDFIEWWGDRELSLVPTVPVLRLSRDRDGEHSIGRPAPRFSRTSPQRFPRPAP